MDFQDVAHWQNNKIDRRETSRMGWSDISISLHGPVVDDLRSHFVQRWNFIYREKYDVRKDVRYSMLSLDPQNPGNAPQRAGTSQPVPPPPPRPQGSSSSYGANQPPPAPQPQYQAYRPSDTEPPQHNDTNRPSNQTYPSYGSQSSVPGSSQYQTPYFPPPPASDAARYRGSDGRERGIDSDDEAARGSESNDLQRHHHLRQFQDEAAGFKDVASNMRGRLEEHVHKAGGEYSYLSGRPYQGGMSCQIVRSCTKWSHGVPTEHSIENAYIKVIQNSRHFIYIENQFFITATGDLQRPIKNRIGAAIVERILRAARAQEKFKIVVIMPAIPGFAGDLKDDSSLGTRAIMEFQYDSINRGGHSILEEVAKAGFDPTQYIRFYNLRNYDRINNSASLREAEQKSHIDYEDARFAYDQSMELPAEDVTYGGTRSFNAPQQDFQRYQQAAAGIGKRGGLGSGRWDSVSECYMLGGKDIREVPWESGDYDEMDAFVSEELYVHSKVLQTPHHPHSPTTH